jgi:methylated-DNA-[protein]-cysteine S-methyltransferase
MEFDSIIATSVGKIGIKTCDGCLVKVEFLPDSAKAIVATNPLAKKVGSQLQQYFKNPKFKFDLPLKVVGTELQQKIWRSLQKIPVGKTLTYKDLALKLQTGPRVIGNACRRNPIPIVIPCHRVVALSGTHGFCGNIKGRFCEIKKFLLRHEIR